MNTPDIKILVREHARFTHYEDGNLWYSIIYSTDVRGADEFGEGFSVPANFDFPVPIDDASGAKFLAEDKGLFFMRWIRKHIELLQSYGDAP